MRSNDEETFKSYQKLASKYLTKHERSKLSNEGNKDYTQALDRLRDHLKAGIKETTERSAVLTRRLDIKNDLNREIQAAREAQSQLNREANNDSNILKIMNSHSIVLQNNLVNLINLLKHLRTIPIAITSLKTDLEHLKESYTTIEISDLTTCTRKVRGDFIGLLKSIDPFFELSFTDQYLQNYLFQQVFPIAEQLNTTFQLVCVKYRDLLELSDINFKSETIPPKNLAIFLELFTNLIEISTGNFDKGTKIEFTSSLSEYERYDLFQTYGILKKPYKAFDLVIEPFVKRFNFMFNNSNSTLSDKNKAEYYLCTVEQWITTRRHFLTTYIDPILKLFSQTHPDAVVQFASALTDLLYQKLAQTIQYFAKDEKLLITNLDKYFEFMRSIDYEFPEFWSNDLAINPLDVIEDDEIFDCYFVYEKFRSTEFITKLFDEDDAWDILFGKPEIPEAPNKQYIVSSAADKFNMLWNGLMDRTRYFRKTEYKIELIKLMVSNFDLVGLCLSQITSENVPSWPLSVKFFSILNTIDYLQSVVSYFYVNPIITEVVKDLDPEIDLFQEIISRFQHLTEASVNTLVNFFQTNLMETFKNYKEQDWHRFTLEEKFSAKCISFVGQINSVCHYFKSNLSSSLFCKFVTEMATCLQDLLFEEFILKKRFNRDGALQLNYDLNNSFYPTFASYMRNTKAVFLKLSNAIILLTCNAVTVKVIKDLIECKEKLELHQVLNRINVLYFSEKTIVEVLNRRIGIHNINAQ